MEVLVAYRIGPKTRRIRARQTDKINDQLHGDSVQHTHTPSPIHLKQLACTVLVVDCLLDRTGPLISPWETGYANDTCGGSQRAVTRNDEQYTCLCGGDHTTAEARPKLQRWMEPDLIRYYSGSAQRIPVINRDAHKWSRGRRMSWELSWGGHQGSHKRSDNIISSAEN